MQISPLDLISGYESSWEIPYIGVMQWGTRTYRTFVLHNLCLPPSGQNVFKKAED